MGCLRRCLRVSTPVSNWISRSRALITSLNEADPCKVRVSKLREQPVHPQSGERPVPSRRHEVRRRTPPLPARNSVHSGNTSVLAPSTTRTQDPTASDAILGSRPLTSVSIPGS
jgi:hypothetical protein